MWSFISLFFPCNSFHCHFSVIVLHSIANISIQKYSILFIFLNPSPYNYNISKRKKLLQPARFTRTPQRREYMKHQSSQATEQCNKRWLTDSPSCLNFNLIYIVSFLLKLFHFLKAFGNSIEHVGGNISGFVNVELNHYWQFQAAQEV